MLDHVLCVRMHLHTMCHIVVQCTISGSLLGRCVDAKALPTSPVDDDGKLVCLPADVRNAQVRAYDDRAALKHRNYLQQSLCPVVRCPYLCGSEDGIGEAGSQARSEEHGCRATIRQSTPQSNTPCIATYFKSNQAESNQTEETQGTARRCAARHDVHLSTDYCSS